jgi:hypothetical protein
MTASHYRCYFLNGERIAAVEVVECDDDAAAVIEADRILAASSYKSIEVWDRGRRVSIISKKVSAP